MPEAAPSIPATMTVIEIAKPGGPEMLVPSQRPVPSPGPGEVLIQVAAAGVIRPDILQRKGGYAPPAGASDIPGLEVAGTVVAAHADVAWPRPGENVCALLAGGGYAAYALAPAPQCLPVPAGLSLVEAAALPECVMTVWTNVFERARLAKGETILIHGGASGIGTTAIQMARALGARVLASAGTPEKCAACVRLGALRAINYRSEDFVAVVREVTGGQGVDVILDMVGGDYTPRNIESLNMEGRLVVIAFLRGARTEIDLNTIMRRRLTLTGSTLRARSVAEKGAIAAAVTARVWPLIEARAMRPVIFATYKLTEAAEAHRLMESDLHTGKIVLVLPSTGL